MVFPFGPQIILLILNPPPPKAVNYSISGGSSMGSYRQILHGFRV